MMCHNPYFSRWFSAIICITPKATYFNVTILILVDGFLQCVKMNLNEFKAYVTILILVDGFLQYGIPFIEIFNKRMSQSLF